MEYLSFKLENYKGISSPVEIVIKKHKDYPFCIVGNNESGKTTILKGIEQIGYLCSGISLENGKINAMRPKSPSFNGEIKLSADLQLDDSEQEMITGRGKKDLIQKLSENNGIIEICFIYVFKNSLKVKDKVEIKIAGDLINNQSMNYSLSSIVENKAPEILYCDDFKFDVPDKIRFLRQKYADDEAKSNWLLLSKQNIVWQKIFDDLLKITYENQNTFQSDIVDWADKHDDDRDTVEQRLTSIQEKLNNVVAQDWVDIIGSKEIFDSFTIAPKMTGDQAFLDYEVKVKAKGKSFSLHERSKGCRWYFCFKILTDIRNYRHSKGIIFLLDEPASNLHIHPQEKILESLKKLSGENDCIVMYSTHSPFLIGTDDKSIENIFTSENSAETGLSAPKIILRKLDSNFENISSPIGHAFLNRIFNEAITKNGNTKEFFTYIFEGMKKFNCSANFIEHIILFFK